MNRPSWSGQVIKVGWSKCPLPAVVILIISIAEIVKTQDGWGEWSGQDDQYVKVVTFVNWSKRHR